MAPDSSTDVLGRLHPGIQRWLRKSGWKGLTAVQRRAIPLLFTGSDAVLEAPTAGGKTEAVLFPTLTRAAKDRGSKGVRILYLAPLKALLNDLELRGIEYAEACGLKAFKWHGDVSQRAKNALSQAPPHLLLTTPESVEAMLLRRAQVKSWFRSLRTVIVDEAHHFAAGDRGGHLLSLLERLGAVARERPQRIALTATIGNPAEMIRWLAGGGELGEAIRVPGSGIERDFELRYFVDDDHDETRTAESQCFSSLYRLLPGRRSIVFVRSRRKAERAAKNLRLMDEGKSRRLRVRTHHSAVSKFYREEAERLVKIRSEEGLDAVLSTSTLELGIDIGELDRVIQLGSLVSPGALLQRVGRTGRRAGKPQYFRGLLVRESEVPLLAATVSLALEGRSEALRFPGRAFHLLAHQLICLSLEHHGIDGRRAWEILKEAQCFRRIESPEVGELVEHMVDEEYLRWADGIIIPGDRAEKELLHSNYRRLFAVFDSVPLYDVLHGKEQVGTLDEGFASGVTAPFLFALAGKLWNGFEIDHERRVVRARPAKRGTAPSWSSFGGPPIPFETAQRMGELLHGCEVLPSFLDDRARDLVARLREAEPVPWQPGEVIAHAWRPGKVRLLTYAGDRINDTLARVFSSHGFEDASSNYSEVVMGTGGVEEAELKRSLDEVWSALRSGPLSQPSRLAGQLTPRLKLFPFSPFARLLPERLQAEALVEQVLDCEGTIELAAGSSMIAAGSWAGSESAVRNK